MHTTDFMEYYVDDILPREGGYLLYKVMYREALPQGPTPYSLVYPFDGKGTLFIYLLWKGTLFV